jgi:hypothetical protein
VRVTSDRTSPGTVAGGHTTVDLRSRARQGIRAIDSVLDAVEQHHLARRPRRVAPRADWIACLEEDGGLTVPAKILLLRDTVQLHGALMDWQDELLNAAHPERASYIRVDSR